MHILRKQGMISGDKIVDLEFCEHCVYGKMHIIKFTTQKHCSNEILKYMYSDLWECVIVYSHGDNKYFIYFFNNYNRNVWIYLLKIKDEANKTLY